MAVSLPASSITAATTACLTPQLPLLSLSETVAKINMPAVVQTSVMNQQAASMATTVASGPMYNLTLSNGEILPATSSTLPKIAVPSVATITVPREFKNDVVTSASQKPIIVTVSGMGGVAKQVQLTSLPTSATNVLTAPIISAPVHMVAQHFTADKLPSSSGIVTLPTIPRAVNVNPILTAKQRSPHLTPLLPGSIITSKGQIVLASANTSLIGSNAAGSVITTMSGISLNSSIVTVTPVIMTSTAPLVSLPANSTVTLNPVSQAQVLSTMIQPNVKNATLQASNKTIVPAAFLKPVNITTSPAQFPVAVQPAPAAITISPAPPPAPVPASVAVPAKEPDVDPKCDPKNPDFDPIQAMEWKDGVATLPGSNIKFKLNEFGILEMVTEEATELATPNSTKEEAVTTPPTAVTSTTPEEVVTESRQKTPRKEKEMYKDENSCDQSSQNGMKDPSMSEELCRCENCDCFGLKVEFCKSGRFCSLSCATSYSNKCKQFYRKNAWLKRGAAKEKLKKKRQKLEQTSSEEAGLETKKIDPLEEPMEEGEKDFFDFKNDQDSENDFSWTKYLKEENAVAAPFKLFKPGQTFPSGPNNFEVGMKLEGIDPKHPSLFCVLSVSEVRGYRIRLHFDGYSECYDFWVNADSQDIFPVGFCEKSGHKLQPPKGFTPLEFDWDSYLKMSKAEAAPKHLFAYKGGQSPNPHFKVGMKLEAVDKKNSSLVCVATVTDVLDSRFLIHFDGWEDVYDYWADASSPYLHPINWCKENDRNLTLPKEFKDSSSFNWTKYLNDTRSQAVPVRAFKPCPPNEFKEGMKLEAVDRRNPILIRVATIAEKTDNSLLIHFDGWSTVYDYWVDDSSPDLHPITWCAKTGHPLEAPIDTASGQTGPCPTAGCLGQGHIKGPKYTTHHSAFGCPYSQINLNKLDNACQDRVILTKEFLYESRRTEQGGATDGLRRCPTPGCNGVGHVKGKYSVHHRVSGCPLAEKNAQRVQLQLQQSSSRSTSPTANNSGSSRPPTPPPVKSSNENQSLDATKPKAGIGRGRKKLKYPGTGLRGRPPKHLSALRLEALKKARETSEKKGSNVEEKVHDTVFSVPFTNPPPEASLTWEHNTSIIPGLSSIKGCAVRQWSVNQVAKFVSSLKGCIDQGKLFREQLIDGEALMELTQSDLIDVLRMRLGPALKVYSSIVAFKESELFA